MEAKEQVEEGISATVVRDAKFYLKEFILIYESKSN